MGGFVKLYDSILDSSVWGEDHETFRVWVTLLLMARPDGVVPCRAPGVANRARVSLPKTVEALQNFCAPDPYSQSREHDGRRLEECEAGFLLLNFAKYREKGGSAKRMQRYRERQRETSRDVTVAQPVVTTPESDLPEGRVQRSQISEPKNGQVLPKTSARAREEQPPCQPELTRPAVETEEKPLPPHVSLPANARAFEPPQKLWQFPAEWDPTKVTPAQRKLTTARMKELGLKGRDLAECWQKHRDRVFEAGFFDPHRQFLRILDWHAKDIHATAHSVGGIHVPPRRMPAQPKPGSEHAEREAAYRKRRTEEPQRRQDDAESGGGTEVASALAETLAPPKRPATSQFRRRMSAEEISAALGGK
jgi:hypothetical protein